MESLKRIIQVQVSKDGQKRITIPRDIAILEGDFIKFEQSGGKVLIKKVDP